MFVAAQKIPGLDAEGFVARDTVRAAALRMTQEEFVRTFNVPALAIHLEEADEAAPAPTASASSEDAQARSRKRRRSEEHTSELQSRLHLVCRLLLEKKKTNHTITSQSR